MSTQDVVIASDNPTIKAALEKYIEELGINQIIFEKLIHHACMQTTTTYGEIAPLVGLPVKGSHMGAVIGQELLSIGRWCMARGWPPLTSLVVRKDTGLPGGGFWAMLGQEGLSKSNQELRTNWYHGQVFAYFDRTLS